MALQVIYYYQMNHMALFPVIPTALTDILDLPKSIARHPLFIVSAYPAYQTIM